MKHEWKKDEKALYKIAKEPSTIEVPKQKFIMIDGKGDPNQAEFSEKIGVLYSVAYPIKMGYKKFCLENPTKAQEFPYQDYSVFPLEGLWTSEEKYDFNKNNLIYTIMIRQPDFITEETFEEVVSTVEKKKPHSLLRDVKFGLLDEGLCIQMLHEGSFDAEVESFEKMDLFAEKLGLSRVNYVHREIYLNDSRKTSHDKLKTILRYQVRKD